MNKTLTVWIMTAGLSWSGCAATPIRATMGQLRSRATYDLACPPQWMRVSHLDDQTKGVEGCGKRVTYVERCEQVGSASCTWTLEMQVREEPSRAEAPVRVAAATAIPEVGPAYRHRPAALPQPPSASTGADVPLDPLADRR